MNKPLNVIIAAIAAGVVCGGGWLMVPALQSSEQAVERLAGIEVERARRLLDRYNAGLTHLSLLMDQFDAAGLSVEEGELTEDQADIYQSIHDELWNSYQPHDWQGESLVDAPARYGNIPGQIQEGLTGHARSASRNRQMLSDALVASNVALSISVGRASSGDHAEALRVKGGVLYQMGIAKILEAKLLQHDLAGLQAEIDDLTARAVRADAATSRVEESGIDRTIASVEERLTQVESVEKEMNGKLAEVTSRVASLKSRIEAADERREKALAERTRLGERGLDFSDPNGAANFEQEYLAMDRAYRDADREVRTLRRGTYPNAHIDYTGDFLLGRYEQDGSAEPVIEFGLSHFLDLQAVLQAEVSGGQEEMAALRRDLATVVAMRENLALAARKATELVAGARAMTEENLGVLAASLGEIEEVEDEALDLLDRAAQALSQATRSADKWIRNARDRTRGLSSEAKSRSAYVARLRDDWRGGFSSAADADAQLAGVSIYYDRLRAAQKQVSLLEKVQRILKIGDLEIANARERAEEARDAGVEQLTSALDALQRAHSKTDNHWTLSAQAAGAMYSMVLLGNDSYLRDTIEAYRTALQGRETRSFASVFARRLSLLESR